MDELNPHFQLHKTAYRFFDHLAAMIFVKTTYA